MLKYKFFLIKNSDTYLLIWSYTDLKCNYTYLSTIIKKNVQTIFILKFMKMYHTTRFMSIVLQIRYLLNRHKITFHITLQALYLFCLKQTLIVHNIYLLLYLQVVLPLISLKRHHDNSVYN